jgi:hypothetical protein
MGKWLFVTGTSKGSYFVVESDGEHREVAGLDINLGVSSGETVNEALQTLLDKLTTSKEVPETLFKKQKLIAYKIEDEGEWIDIKKQLVDSSKDKEVVETTNTVYENIKCKWCSENLPKNGAAQFSHLKKHLKQLVSGGRMTQEIFNKVNSITLKDDVVELLQQAKADGLLHTSDKAVSGSAQQVQTQVQTQQKP